MGIEMKTNGQLLYEYKHPSRIPVRHASDKFQTGDETQGSLMGQPEPTFAGETRKAGLFEKIAAVVAGLLLIILFASIGYLFAEMDKYPAAWQRQSK